MGNRIISPFRIHATGADRTRLGASLVHVSLNGV